MLMKLMALVAAFALCSSVSLAGAEQAKPNDAAQILSVLQTLVDSQVTFDQKRMDAVLTPDYFEVSPVGDVDERAKVLSFYAPDQKPPGPAGKATLSEVASRGHGEMAVTVAKLTFNITMPNGEAAIRAMRVVFITRNISGRWLIASSQFTPIRTK
jgi:hypothetical protein